MASAKQFWDKRAKKYAASAIGDEAAYEHTLKRTLAHLTPDMTVLELGCGTGTTAVHLAPSAGDYTGSDVSSEMIRIAQDKGAGIANLAFIVAGAAEALETGPRPDAVLAFNVLHLLPDTADVIQAAHARLEGGGLFISKTACIADPSIGPKRFAIAALVPVMQLLGIAPFVHRLTFAAVEKMVTDAGFEIIEKVSGPAMSRYLVARKQA